MSNVIVLEEEPFAGWDHIRTMCRQIGALRILRHLVNTAALQVRESGTFVGNSEHSYHNHPILVRALVRMLVDAGDQDFREEPLPLTGEEIVQVRALLRQIHWLASRIYTPKAIGPSTTVDLIRVVAEQSSLAKYRNRHSSFEIARTWRLFRDLWPQAAARAGTTVERAGDLPLNTAFDCIENALTMRLLALGRGGFIVEPRRYFSRSELGVGSEQFIQHYSVDAASAVGTWDDIESDPRGGAPSPFHDAPVLRFGSYLLLAPDPGLLFSGLHFAILERILGLFPKDPSMRERVRTTHGFAFEAYVREIVAECGALTAESYVDEFDYRIGRASPDAMLVRDTACVFEAKASAPHGGDEPMLSVESLLRWLRMVTGERPGSRGPLAQGAQFLSAWKGGDAGIRARLGAYPGNPSILYVVVCPDDVPVTVFWERFRNDVWRAEMKRAERTLDTRTLFVSIMDLEALWCALKQLRDVGERVSAYELLLGWRSEIALSSSLLMAEKQLLPCLKDYLLSRMPGLRKGLPPLLERSLEDALRATMTQVAGRNG